MDLVAVYRDKSASLASKATLFLLHGAIALIVLWMLFGGGPFGFEPRPGTPLRRAALAAAAVLYALRTSATLFVFSRRRLPWSEVATIAVWIGIIDLLFAYFGGGNPARPGAAEAVGACLVLLGSVINTGSEWQRHRWKGHAENRGHLLTAGWWSVARHANYFGDVVLFSGWALLTGRPALLLVPAVMICLFALVNIPAQDRYLAERYGEEYEAYARRTARLLPLVY